MRIQNDLSVIADTFEGEVLQFLNQEQVRVADFASDIAIRNATASVLRGDLRKRHELTDYLLAAKKPLDKTIADITILSLRGEVVVSTDRSRLQTSLRGQEISEAGKRTTVATVSDGRLLVATPIRNTANEAVEAVLVDEIEMMQFDRLFAGILSEELGAVTWNAGRPKSLTAYLVSAERRLISGGIPPKDPLRYRTTDGVDPIAQCIEHNTETQGRYRNFRNRDVIGVSMCIQSPRWTLLVEEDADEVLVPPLRTMQRNTLLATFAVLGVLGGLFYLFWRNVVTPVVDINKATREIAAGDYHVAVPVRSSDEIGLLAASFNDMAREIESRTDLLKAGEERYRAILDNINEIIYQLTFADGYFDARIEFVSAQCETITGYRPEEFQQDPQLWGRITHPGDTDAVRESTERIFGSRQVGVRTYRMKKKGCDDYLWIEDKVVPQLDTTGTPIGCWGVARDITERKKMEDAVRDSEQKFRAIFDSVQDGILVADVVTRRFLFANATMGAMLGYGIDEIAALGMEDIHPREDLQAVGEQFRNMASGEAVSASDIRMKRRDGSIFYADVSGSPLMLEGKRYLIGIFRDITGRKQAEEERRVLSAAIEHSVNVMFITDRNGKIEYVNPTFERVTGWTREEALGENPRILASGATTLQEYEEMWSTILDGKTWRGTLKNRRKDGRFYWSTSVITPIKNDMGSITHFLAVAEDITERKKTEERLQYLTVYDELTGLYNRVRFMELVDEWLRSARDEEPRRAGLLLIDIDEFKYVNDTYGHTSGDDFIRQIGGVLRRSMRDMEAEQERQGDGMMLGRMGGDEFAVFLPRRWPSEALDAAERFRRAVERYRIMEGAGGLTVSIGVSVYPEHGASVKDLFTKADAALYHIKRTGKNRVHLFHPDKGDLEFMHARLRQKEQIQTAIVEDRFLPWFQPILMTADNSISHYEALARMQAADGTVLTPGDFIESAEIFSLIAPIDRIIIEKTMRLQAEMARRGRELTFGMNLSGKELGDEEMLEFLQRAVRTTGADPQHLLFEITETAAVHDLDRANRFINALRELGFRFSLDDFGVGFTSFMYLREMRVDYIKIDGSFVRNLRENRNDRLFVKSIIDVARGMQIKTVAEFVENAETLGLLRELGVDYAQGYLIGRPAPGLLPPEQSARWGPGGASQGL